MVAVRDLYTCRIVNLIWVGFCRHPLAVHRICASDIPHRPLECWIHKYSQRIVKTLNRRTIGTQEPHAVRSPERKLSKRICVCRHATVFLECSYGPPRLARSLSYMELTPFLLC